eukprot:12409640-Karenia_brevis.AAC.1
MVAVVQSLPSKKINTKGQLVVTRPTTSDHLEARGHQIDIKGNRLCNALAQQYGDNPSKTGHG